MIVSQASGDILDVGCGYTQLPEEITHITSYTGIDVHQKIIEHCRNRYPQHEFHCLNLDEEAFPSFGHPFDTVIMTAVIEHLHEPVRVLQAIRPLLKDNGHVLITTPSPLGDLAHQIGSRIRLFYPEAIVGHVKIFTKNELCDLLVNCGYEIQQYRRFLIGLNQLVVGQPDILE